MKVLISLAYIMIISFCVAAAVAQETDEQITKAVKTALIADETLAGAAIDVSTTNGVVTLKGKVIGHDEADRAVDLVRTVSGVEDVVSKLDVDVHLTNKDVEDRLDAREETTEEKKEIQEQDVDHSDDGILDDAAITAAVKLKLAGDQLGSMYRINVDTENGVVRLEGIVKSEPEALHFVDLAQGVEGVKSVVSVITVEP